ncbi:MAG TPA: glycosyltransferase family 4 protein, partial [Candidatus Deferrimicrobiaceae bacterium]
MADPGAGRPVRILFLAFGYSVHAERRIRPFVEDGRFEVAVASPHDYGFEGARNVTLDGKHGERNRQGVPGSIAGRIRGRLRHELAGAVHRFMAKRDAETHRYQVDRWLDDRDALRDAIREFGPDILFLQTLLYPSWLAFPIPSGMKTIVTFWNGDVLWWAQWNGIERLFKKWIVRHGARRAAAVTVNSEAAAEACRRYGTKAERIHL